MKLRNNLQNVVIADLSTIHDSSKSFYGKAQIVYGDFQTFRTIALYSYGTLIAEVCDSGAFYISKDWNYSATTKRHLKEFMAQFVKNRTFDSEHFKNSIVDNNECASYIQRDAGLYPVFMPANG